MPIVYWTEIKDELHPQCNSAMHGDTTLRRSFDCQGAVCHVMSPGSEEPKGMRTRKSFVVCPKWIWMAGKRMLTIGSDEQQNPRRLSPYRMNSPRLAHRPLRNKAIAL